MTPEGFAKLTGVSRETLERFQAYVTLLTAWNRRINLVGPNTIGDIWRRHILDSAQLMPLLPDEARVVVDIGSGAGLPGLILSILGVPEVHLIESDQRKAVFLREAQRVTGAPVTIHAQRAERLAPLPADAVVARAIAPVDNILLMVDKFLTPYTICLFLKGKGIEQELTRLPSALKMKARILPSRSDPTGRILRLEGPYGSDDANR
ncbi:MAG: 16S rRNA (guanine(527)-N(7))-methyltransferase RsmG [Alphaproteobacteria bacterium]|nr:16S rRNA (guanine(527)-N(7))-methyltransferase RsmG [Alphaproteobacteria bacterium]